MRDLLKTSLICSLTLSACAHGPKIEVCISEPVLDGFSCYDEQTGKNRILSYLESAHYVAFSPQDIEVLTAYYGEKCKGAQ